MTNIFKSSVSLAFIVLLFLTVQSNESIRQSEWQQRCDHNICVELKFITSKNIQLEASQKVVYYNNSPDTLSEIYFHLWANAYKNNHTPFANQQAATGKKDFLLPHSQKGGIEVQNVLVNGKATVWLELSEEIALIRLNQPLLPNQKVEIEMDFNVQMPGFYSRMGADSFFIAATQWYPKPAVYDVNGWNTMPYLDQGEFYSEFGRYDVQIRVPDDFIVGATGNLQTHTELQRLKNLSDFYLHKTQPKPQFYEDQTKTLVFVQDSVHDFAWFASNKFAYAEAYFDLNKNKKVKAEFFSYQAIPSALDLKNIENSVIFYSDQIGEYPYDKCGVVIGSLQAGGGMEYPTITVCAYNSLDVILHEIGHNWFYGILASNERRYPWMDESLNTFYEQEYFKLQLLGVKNPQIDMMNGGNSAFYYFKNDDKLLNLFLRRIGQDQGADLSSEDFLPLNYYTVIYGRAAHYIGYLRDVLGAEVFNKAMKDYYQKWKFKHPLPGDFADALSISSGQDLSWFIDALLPLENGTNFIFNKVERVEENKIQVSIKNKTGAAVPLVLGFLSWKNELIKLPSPIAPFAKDTTLIIEFVGLGEMKKMLIDPNHNLPENHRQRNIIKIPDVNHIKYSQPKVMLRLRPSPENPYTWDLNLNPAINYNIYSGVGLGLSVFNRLFPLKDFEYDITGYYSLSTQNVIGNGSLGWNIVQNNKRLERIRPGLDLQRYNYRPNNVLNTFNKVNPNLVLFMKYRGKHSPRFSQQIRADWFYIFSDKQQYNVGNVEGIYFAPNTHLSIGKLTYKIRDNHALTPMSFVGFIEGGKTGTHNPSQNKPYAKLDARYRFEINQRGVNRKFKLQANAGALLWNPQNVSGLFLFRGSGNTGIMDYTYSETLLGRNQDLREGLWGRQMVTAGGDMRINAISFIANHYVSLKLEQSLPMIPFLRVYADFAQAPFDNFNSRLNWCSGLTLVLWDDILEISFPFLYSNNFHRYFELNNITMIQRLNFKLDMNFFYPRKNIEKFRPLFGF